MPQELKATSLDLIFNILLFVIAYFLSRNAYWKNARTVNKVYFCCILFFCLFSFYGGDYFSYWESYLYYKKTGENWTFEDVYLRIMDISPAYLIFRTIVWGGGLLCYYYASRIINVDKRLFALFFLVYLLLSFSYARITLGMSILMLGYALIISGKKINILRITIGICLLLVSTLFHRSVILPVAVAVVSIIRLKKWQLITLLVLFPIIIKVLNDHLYSLITTSGVLNVDQINKAIHYISDDYQKERGIASIINFALQFVTTYYATYLITKVILHTKKGIAKIQAQLATFAVGVVFCASVFIFIPNGFVLFYRILAMAKFPILLDLCLLKEYIGDKNIKRFIYVCLLSVGFQLSYSLYLSIVQ